MIEQVDFDNLIIGEKYFIYYGSFTAPFIVKFDHYARSNIARESDYLYTTLLEPHIGSNSCQIGIHRSFERARVHLIYREGVSSCDEGLCSEWRPKAIWHEERSLSL